MKPVLKISLSQAAYTSTMNIEALCLELVEQHPQTTSTRRLSADLGPSKSTITPGHLNKIGLVNKRCRREVPQELTVDQQQRRVDDTCTKLLKNPTDSRF